MPTLKQSLFDIIPPELDYGGFFMAYSPDTHNHRSVLKNAHIDEFDDTPMGKFARMVLAFVAEMEREKIMDRTTTGRVNKAKAGEIVSGSKAPMAGRGNTLETRSLEESYIKKSS